MADKETQVHIGENSPERIAYVLMLDVLNAEKVKFDDRTRKLLLDTYAECLDAALSRRSYPNQ